MCKLVYASVPRYLTIAWREQLAQTGLGDRKSAVHLAAGMCRWASATANPLCASLQARWSLVSAAREAGLARDEEKKEHRGRCGVAGALYQMASNLPTALKKVEGNAQDVGLKVPAQLTMAPEKKKAKEKDNAGDVELMVLSSTTVPGKKAKKNEDGSVVYNVNNTPQILQPGKIHKWLAYSIDAVTPPSISPCTGGGPTPPVVRVCGGTKCILSGGTAWLATIWGAHSIVHICQRVEDDRYRSRNHVCEGLLESIEKCRRRACKEEGEGTIGALS
ncbi:hypothetical protein B0H19DRAFT_1367040 [Mycena capillaripes]|nr:hypothetical protein B0H19DRAFT_1367040 [Mycena capillaripes]